MVDEQNVQTEDAELPSPLEFRKDGEEENRDSEKDEDTREAEAVPCKCTEEGGVAGNRGDKARFDSTSPPCGRFALCTTDGQTVRFLPRTRYCPRGRSCSCFLPRVLEEQEPSPTVFPLSASFLLSDPCANGLDLESGAAATLTH